jgi:hypothetical protein
MEPRKHPAVLAVSALGAVVIFMTSNGPDEAVVNFCKWPRKAVSGPPDCLSGLPGWALYAAAGLLILGGLVWYFWPDIVRWRAQWLLRWPIVRAQPPAVSPTVAPGDGPTLASKRYYSRAEKDTLGDLYAALTRLFIPHGGGGGGEGFYKKAALLGNEWINQNQQFHAGADLNLPKIQMMESAARNELDAIHATLYGDTGIVKDNRYLPYEREIWFILQDTNKQRITQMRDALAAFGTALSGLYRFGSGSRDHTAHMMESVSSNAQTLIQQTQVFQHWLFDATQRVEKCRDALSD